MKRITIIALSTALLVACTSFGKDAPKTNPYDQRLAVVPAAELPAKAADLVSQAKPRAQQGVTVDVVKSAVALNPAAAPAIVGAIARAVPDMAAVAAGVAAAQQPRQARAIAKAAAAAAPKKAGEIVMSVCRAVPNDYREIAVAVSQAVSGADKEIVNAVGSGVPHLKRSIEKALAGYGGNVTSVADTLTQAARISQTQPVTSTASLGQTSQPRVPTVLGGASMARGPAGGPPYVPLSATPTNVTSSGSGEVPSGGRNYAAP